jgi:hypothetical protein
MANETTPAPSLMTDLSNLGISAYDYFQNQKAYNDIIQRYRDAMAQNTQASNNAIGLMNNAYDATAGYSKNKYDDLMHMVGQTSNALNQQSNNQYDKSTAINANNLNTQNNQLASNLNTQKNLVQQGYNDSRNDLSSQMNPAINAYNSYTQGGNNAQGLLDRFLTGDPNTRVADYIKTPGYDFRYKEGMNALDRSASARGALLGGAAIKEAMKYGQDMAQQGYDSYLNQLAGQSAQGLNATNAQGNLRQNYATALGNTSANRANALAGANQDYTNAVNQNTGAYNQQALTNINNSTNMNNDLIKFGYQERTGATDNRYNDLANIIMGKNQNQANIGMQNQGVLNDILGKIAQQQYNQTSNIKPVSNLVTTGGNLLGNILGGGQSGSSTGGGIGDLFKNILGGSSGGSNTGNSSWLNTIGSWF